MIQVEISTPSKPWRVNCLVVTKARGRVVDKRFIARDKETLYDRFSQVSNASLPQSVLVGERNIVPAVATECRVFTLRNS